MSKSAVPAILLLTILFGFAPSKAKTITSLSINPSISSFDSSIISSSFKKQCFLQPVINLSPDQDSSGIVGETRVRWNTKVPIICNPSPSACLYTSFQTLLTNNNIAATSETEADYIFTFSIHTFSLKESYNKITQTMDAFVTIEVVLIDNNNNGSPKRFTVSTQNSYTTLDTSKHSEKILREALKDAIKKIAGNLEK